ncbi:MAG TPA: hypothetical protein EYP22_01335 [Methanosarcinales archaeon]|nr:hypothetical protein [Methanosarcinales archaeon]
MAKSTVIVLVAMLILFASIYLIGKTKTGEVLDVQVIVGGSYSEPVIEDISARLERHSKISVPRGNPLMAPGITVRVIKNNQIISHWTSIGYNGTGKYNIMVGFLKGITYPKKGDKVRIIAYILDGNSNKVDAVAMDVIIS